MYRFTPPTTTVRAGTDRLWRRVKNNAGRAVVIYTDGRVVPTDSPPSHTDEGVDTVYPGGRTYEIEDSVAEVLIDSGYSAYLEEVVA